MGDYRSRIANLSNEFRYLPSREDGIAGDIYHHIKNNMTTKPCLLTTINFYRNDVSLEEMKSITASRFEDWNTSVTQTKTEWLGLPVKNSFDIKMCIKPEPVLRGN
jgi:hypothetical protein